jgi:hypothetical protein
VIVTLCYLISLISVLFQKMIMQAFICNFWRNPVTSKSIRTLWLITSLEGRLC